MISQPPHIWYHIQYTCGILSTIFMTSHPLCMTTQHCVLLIWHSAYVWHNLYYRWYHIHSITPNHSIYDITCTSGMASHPLYQTSHPLSSQPLYWYHTQFCMTSYPHSMKSYPLYVWHHIHSIYHINSLCHHTTVLWHHSLYIWNHIQYVGPHMHYTCDITANNQCHHSHSIDNITHILYDITLR